MNFLLKQLVRHWQVEDIKFHPGESLENIQYIEKSMGYLFPEEFIFYLQTINGMVDGESDKDLFYFWTSDLIFSEIRNTFNTESDSVFIGFADRIVIDSIYMIEVSKIRQPTGKIAIKHNQLELISPHFYAFLEEYLIKSSTVYGSRKRLGKNLVTIQNYCFN